MIDLTDINNAIEELENQELTFDICQKLSSLYIIKRYYQNEDVVVDEYNDILPSYQRFCEIKRKYQLNDASEDSIYRQLQLVCSEIREFLQTLYHNTDTQRERNIIEEMLKNII